MIQAEELRKRFGGFTAVDGISFEVRPGEVLGFLGPNGAGKSTTMRMLTGFLPPTGGRALIDGQDMEREPLAAKRSLGYLPENAPSYPDMSVQGFLEFCAEMRGFTGAARKDAVSRVVEKCGLGGVLFQTIETLSKGYHRRVCLAQAILHNPDNLILDEPTDGLDPNQKNDMRRMIREMGKDKAIILSTHILEEVEAVCTRVAIIDHGKLIFNGTPAELQGLSPDAGAVRIRMTQGLEATAEALRKVAGVTEVLVEKEGLLVRGKGEDLSLRVKHALDAGQKDFSELTVVHGRLDEVFRQLTKGTL